MKFFFLFFVLSMTKQDVDVTLENGIVVVVFEEIAQNMEVYQPYISFIIQNVNYGQNFGKSFENELFQDILLGFHQITLQKEFEDIQNNETSPPEILEKALNFFKDNIIANLSNLFEHLNVEGEKEMLSGIFFENQDPFEILKVSLPLGDIHKVGGGVSILTLKQKKKTLKIVHKSSSIKIDYMITGKTTAISPEYKQLLGLSEIPSSFFEIVNAQIKDLKMKTYIIVPKESSVDISLTYGYLEFIEQDNVSPQSNIKDIIKFMRPLANEENILVIPEDYFYVTPDDSNRYKNNEIDNLAYQSGIILGTVFLFKSTDLHLENVLISNKLPVIIDLENSFDSRDSTTSLDIALNGGVGGLNYEGSICEVTYYYLKNDQGKIYQIDNSNLGFLLSKNFYKKFGFFKKNCCGCAGGGIDIDEKLEVNKPLMIKGFKDLLNLLQAKKDEFQTFYESLNNLICREVPLATQEFKGLRSKTDNTIRREQLNEIIQNKIENNDLPELFRDEGIITRINQNLDEGYIPSFYFNIQNQIIYGADGIPFLKSGESDLNNPVNFFFKETPLENFLKDKNIIEGEDNDTRKKLIDSQNEHLKQLLKISEEKRLI